MKITYKNGHKYLVGTLVILYIVLFEFVIPQNTVLPKPVDLLLATIALFKDYGLFYSLFFTLSAFLIGSSLSIGIMHIFSGIVVKSFSQFPPLNKIFNGTKYLPLMFVPILLAFWFNSSIWAEYLYAFIICGYFIKMSIAAEVNKVNPAYIISSKSLGIDENKIYSEVAWKSILPAVIKKYISYSSIILTYLFIYEYIVGVHGVGEIYRSILEYNDFAAIFALTFIIAITSYLVKLLFNFIESKLIYWEQ